MKLSNAVKQWIQELRVTKAPMTVAGYESDLHRLTAMATQDTIIAVERAFGIGGPSGAFAPMRTYPRQIREAVIRHRNEIATAAIAIAAICETKSVPRSGVSRSMPAVASSTWSVVEGDLAMVSP